MTFKVDVPTTNYELDTRKVPSYMVNHLEERLALMGYSTLSRAHHFIHYLQGDTDAMERQRQKQIDEYLTNNYAPYAAPDLSLSTDRKSMYLYVGVGFIPQGAGTGNGLTPDRVLCGLDELLEPITDEDGNYLGTYLDVFKGTPLKLRFVIADGYTDGVHGIYEEAGSQLNYPLVFDADLDIRTYGANLDPDAGETAYVVIRQGGYLDENGVFPRIKAPKIYCSGIGCATAKIATDDTDKQQLPAYKRVLFDIPSCYAITFAQCPMYLGDNPLLHLHQAGSYTHVETQITFYQGYWVVDKEDTNVPTGGSITSSPTEGSDEYTMPYLIAGWHGSISVGYPTLATVNVAGYTDAHKASLYDVDTINAGNIKWVDWTPYTMQYILNFENYRFTFTRHGEVVRVTTTTTSTATTVVAGEVIDGLVIPEGFRPTVTTEQAIKLNVGGVYTLGVLFFNSNGDIVLWCDAASETFTSMAGGASWITSNAPVYIPPTASQMIDDLTMKIPHKL